MTVKNDYDIATVYNDRSDVLGFIWQKHSKTAWGALLSPYCAHCGWHCTEAQQRLGAFHDRTTAIEEVLAHSSRSTVHLQ
jgi:hypothetical protein